MIEPVKSPPLRVLAKSRYALWLVVWLALAALVFAAGAQARGSNASDAATEAPISPVVTESGASSEQAPPTTAQTSSAGETPPSSTEQAPSAAEEPALAAEQTPLVAAETAPSATEQTPSAAEAAPPTTEVAPLSPEQAPPAVGESPPAPEQVPPVGAEAAPPTNETAPSAPEQAPPVADETTPPPKQVSVTETAPPTVEHVAETEAPTEKKTGEQTTGGGAAGAGSEGPTTPRAGDSSQAFAGASGPTHDDTAGEVAPGDSIAATVSTTPDVLSEIPTVHEQPSLTSVSRAAAPRRVGQASCESAAIGASIATDDAGGWLDLVATASSSTANFAVVDASPTATVVGAPAGSQDGGSAVVDHPSAPTPGSGGGGAGGGSAAGGGSGSASSASVTLVGALLQAAPRAIRRFRLAQPSWRTSFFVLIPERPD